MKSLLLLVPIVAWGAEPPTETPQTNPNKEWCVEIKTSRPGKDGRQETVTTKVCGPLPEPSKEPAAPKSKD